MTNISVSNIPALLSFQDVCEEYVSWDSSQGLVSMFVCVRLEEAWSPFVSSRATQDVGPHQLFGRENSEQEIVGHVLGILRAKKEVKGTNRFAAASTPRAVGLKERRIYHWSIGAWGKLTLQRYVELKLGPLWRRPCWCWASRTLRTSLRGLELSLWRKSLSVG